MPPKRDPPSLEETVAILAEQVTKINGQFAEDRTAIFQLLRETQSKTNASLDTIATRITELRPQPPPPPKQPYVEHPSSSDSNQDYTPHQSRFRPPETHPNSPIKPPRINLAVFDGSQPLDWLFQANQFFALYHVPEQERIPWVSFYMQGDALSWYKHLYDNRLLRDWRTFTRDLEVRFGPSTFDNHQASLFKLRQRGTVVEFQTEFERIANCVVGLPLEALKNCFISGLRNDIQRELAILHPRTLTEAVGQAKLIEAKVQDSRGRNPLPPNRPPFYTKGPPTTPTSFPALPAPPLRANPTPTFKRLTPEELRYKRENGLCFSCPEKFQVGHKCKQPHFLYLSPAPNSNTDQADYDLTEEIEDNEEQQPAVAPDPATIPIPASLFSSPSEHSGTLYQLSLAACYGSMSPRTLRINGLLHGQTVTILVDSGSTHNIVQTRIAESIRLPVQPRSNLPVMVGSGEYLECRGACTDVPILMKGHRFVIPLLVLPIYGADIVLGIEWLSTLGTIQADFAVPQITFHHQGELIQLSGKPALSHSTESQFRRLLHTNVVASVHAIWHNQSPPAPSLSQAAEAIPIPLQELLLKYDNIFQPPPGLPPSRLHDHHINLLPDSQAVNVRPYRYPHYQKEIMTQLITDMLREGVIRPSTSPFSSPVLLVRKKDGTWRFCVDYRALNAITIRDRFPIPTVDELLDELHGATTFSKIDLRSGYHQIRVASPDIHKTAFRTVDGHYEFTVMPFGLTNAPSTFQHAMNDLFRKHLRRFVLVFFDDILIYSKTMTDHVQHLQQVFHILASNQYFAKLNKCVFGVSEIHYLGHIISATGVAADPEKLQAISQWPCPNSLTALRGFLGLTGYYRRFVRHYAKIADPLTDLLRSTTFSWTTEAQHAFDLLKERMTTLPVLVLPDFSLPFEVTTDASGCAIGAVLSQLDHPIAFFSKKLSGRMQAAGAYTRELYAVTQAVQKWRQYLLGQSFIIYTDQQSLKHLLTQTIQTPDQEKWLSKLMGYSYEIRYKPGAENKVADALSRKQEAGCFAIASLTFPWLDTLRDHFASSPSGQQLIARLLRNEEEVSQYHFHNGLVYYKSRLYIPQESGLQQPLLTEYHGSPLGGHSGVKATAARLAASFYWPNLMHDVQLHIRSCTMCQQTKYIPSKPFGLLQPLPIPDQVWEDLSMDFITQLPSSFGKTTIWVVVDRLSKFAHFIALPPRYTASSVAALFMTEIFKLHGLPRSIVSDRDSLFLSTFWRELFRLMGTTLKYSSAYHPQTDGQTEVVNRCLESYLRCFVCDEPKQWTRYLSLAEYWYNTSFHSSLKMSPFQALYGRIPPTIPSYLRGTSKIASLDDSLGTRAAVLQQLKQSLQASQARMTSQANKHRRDLTFQPGDLVYLRLRPYRQTSLHHRSSPKLSRRYYGPFRVIRPIGRVAYELDLPKDAKLHRVFHVSLLRPCFGPPPTDSTPLPAIDEEGRPCLPVHSLLQQRIINRDGHDVPQVLVQWDDTPIEEASWEDVSAVQTSVPGLADKATVEGEGIDRPEDSLAVEEDLHADRLTRKKRQPRWFQDYLLS